MSVTKKMELKQEFEMVEVDRLKEHPRNPRKGNTEVIRESIEKNGFYGAVIVQRSTGRILAGNHRWKAAKMAGESKVPVAWVDVDEEHATRILLADNRTNDLASYNESELSALLVELNEAVGLDGTGYTESDLEELLAELTPEVIKGNTDPDDVPEKAPKRCNKGDMWRMGDHLLMCGDSSKKKDIENLMQGEKADLCFTSPPYNANTKAGQGAIFNGKKPVKLYREGYQDNLDSSSYVEFASGVLDLCFDVTDGFIFWNVSYNSNSKFEYIQQIQKKLPYLVEQVCWKKNSTIPFKGMLKRDWEPIYVFSTNKKSINVSEIYSNVWDVANRGSQTETHKACYPVNLPSKGIEIVQKKTGIVFDPFGGSGTTLIACEQSGRRCRMMELDPEYCDCILQRWEDFTGEKAVRVMKSDDSQ